MVHLGNDWDSILQEEFQKSYYLSLREFLKKEYEHYTVYPAMNDIFNALKHTAYSDTKVVILGQDPYHNPNQAHGLAFSVQKENPLPPSLKNIYEEIEHEFGISMGSSGDLTPWAKQGVLLLNAVLTVRAPLANSHKGKGWEFFTDAVIRYLNNRPDPVIFLLWGRDAKEKESLITNPNHVILRASHPSPLSAYQSFFGCGHFRKVNECLSSWQKKPIDWKIS
ncbi:MAG: uracil-DNA glycosylase [Bacilli bacterium]|nr:uracil-DNA glycosylase [Bacilli bacterium]